MTGTMTNLDDHRTPYGDFDLKSYHAAQKQNGEVCSRCGKYFSLYGEGRPAECRDCKAIDSDKEEVEHDSLIRCPHCRTVSNPYDSDSYQLLSDGSHAVTCDECGEDFEVETAVSYRFTSRKLDE